MFSTLRKLTTAAATLAVTLAFSVAAQAAPINHTSFGVAGGLALSSGTDLGNTNSFTVTNAGHVTVTAADPYDLAAMVTLGESGTMQGIANISSFSPIANFLVLASGVRLDLNSLNVESRDGGPPGFLNLSGRGVLHAIGFDDTAGLFSFSGTTTDNLTFSFAVESSTVPEPFSLGLLGLGLTGIALRRRSKQQQAL